MLRTPADIAFSHCVRERANWTCQKCENYFPEGSRGGLDCSHHHGRRSWSIRFNPLNAEALCYGCHSHYGGTEERRDETLTEDEQILLFRLKEDVSLAKIYRKTQGKGDISKHYRKELAKMQEARANGEAGILTFKVWL